MEIESLRANLSFVYRLVVASEALLDFALDFSDAELRAYYEKHLEEEAGHAEMFLGDLREMAVVDPPKSHLAAELAGSQYYLIAHDHPALLLGYMHALESNVIKPEQLKGLQERHGLRLAALAYHVEHDPQHVRDLVGQIERLPQELQRSVAWNENYCLTLLAVADRQLRERGVIS